MFGAMQQFRRAATSAASSATPRQTYRKDVNALKLHIGNLPWTIGKAEFRNYFAQFGPIARAEVIFDMETGMSRGFGFVTFDFSHSLVKAIKTKHQMLEGNLLEITIPKVEKPAHQEISNNL